MSPKVRVDCWSQCMEGDQTSLRMQVVHSPVIRLERLEMVLSTHLASSDSVFIMSHERRMLCLLGTAYASSELLPHLFCRFLFRRYVGALLAAATSVA